ncbi:LD-carboxypeptidase [bacterium]|nr:LD-carboxypeptidase [bacterium]
MYILPPAVKPGATIGVVSPASTPSDKIKVEKGIQYLQDKGFTVVLGSHVLDQYGYLAGTDEARAADFNAMFRNPDIDAIICSRGGYGTPRILPLLDYDAIRENPKVFVGYSDISAIQHAILAQTGLITFSGPMVAVEMYNGIEPFTEQHFWPMVMGENNGMMLSDTEKMPFQVMNPGKASGRISGGCLSVFAPLIGTRYQPDYENTILVIEDIGEEIYGIDRIFCQLEAAGILGKINGLVLGQFLDTEATEPGNPTLTLEQVFTDLLGELSIPVIKNYAYGHGMTKFTIPVGAEAVLDTEQGLFQAKSCVTV